MATDEETRTRDLVVKIRTPEGLQSVAMTTENFSLIHKAFLVETEKTAAMHAEYKAGEREAPPGVSFTAQNISKAAKILIQAGDPKKAAAWLTVTQSPRGETVKVVDLTPRPFRSRVSEHKAASILESTHLPRGPKGTRGEKRPATPLLCFNTGRRDITTPVSVVFVRSVLKGARVSVNLPMEEGGLTAAHVLQARANTKAFLEALEGTNDLKMTLAYVAFHCHSKGMWEEYSIPRYARTALSKEVRGLKPAPRHLVERDKEGREPRPMEDIFIVMRTVVFMADVSTFEDFVAAGLGKKDPGTATLAEVQALTKSLWKDGVATLVAKGLSYGAFPEIVAPKDGYEGFHNLENLALALENGLRGHSWSLPAYDGCPITFSRILGPEGGTRCSACGVVCCNLAVRAWMERIRGMTTSWVCPTCHSTQGWTGVPPPVIEGVVDGGAAV